MIILTSVIAVVIMRLMRYGCGSMNSNGSIDNI